jgi:hypothetical protein
MDSAPRDALLGDANTDIRKIVLQNDYLKSKKKG